MRTLALLIAAPLLALPVSAQIPNTLLHSVPAPPTGVQSGGNLGYSVAVDGGLIVLGSPLDDFGATDAGSAKVFDSATGALLHVLANPSPAASDNFGWSVSISGNRVVVGAHLDDTGAGNAGSAYVYDLSSGTPTVPVATLNNPGPGVGDNFGFAVSISGSRVAVVAPYDDTGAADAGNAYVYDVSSGTPTVPVAVLNNPGPAFDDRYGWSVAISGTRVVVGAVFDDVGASNTGNAYVFDLSSGTPTVPVFTLNNPSAEASDQFGRAVAISGTRMVVGAISDNTGATGAGSAYVYDLTSGTPTVPIHTLNNPTPAMFDNFGNSVSISGTRVVVAAFVDDTGAADSGSTYVYDLSSGTPTIPVATLNNPSPAASDRFGQSVSISGTRLVAGAYQDDTGASDVGSAYVYELSSGTPTVPVITLNSPSPVAGDQFGAAVSVSGTRMVVGAPYDDTGGADSGRVYVYDLISSTPTLPLFELNNPSPAANDNFGVAVAISGSRVVVGAYQDDSGASNAGSAYVYDLSSGTPTVPVTTLNNPSPAVNDDFGWTVTISGIRVVIGVPYDDTGATDAGSAYVYDLSTGTPAVPVLTLNNPAPAVGDAFGRAAEISGARVVVGAYLDDTGAADAGSAYVYDLGSGTPTVPMVTLNNPAPAASDLFGYAVGISGNLVVVGAFSDNTAALNSGSAYVYDLSSGTPAVPMATLNNPTPTGSDEFGFSVSISGTRVVVGDRRDDTGMSDAGGTCVYDMTSGTPTVPVATLNNPGPTAGDQFGYTVAIDGTTVAIGTPFDDTVMTDKGYTYVFGPPPEIVVEVQPSNANISDGGSHDFGTVVTGGSASVTFTVKNTGFSNLLLGGTPKVAVSGTHAAMFGITAQPVSPVSGPGGSTVFTVQFLPSSAGVKTAALSIPNNDADEAPFDINVSGTALSFTTDTDSDGLSDASEFQMAALGFDWQVNQTALVTTLTSSLNGAGWFTPSQVQALNAGVPLIQRNATTGIFTLTLGVEKSTDLSIFSPFPMTAPQTLINGAGKLEFQFTVPDNAAFFQLRAQ